MTRFGFSVVATKFPDSHTRFPGSAFRPLQTGARNQVGIGMSLLALVRSSRSLWHDHSQHTTFDPIPTPGGNSASITFHSSITVIVSGFKLE
jgi:hypothetical protein